MGLSEYRFEMLRKDGEFIVYRCYHRRQSIVYSRDDPCLGTPRIGKPQENRTRIFIQGRARSRLGSSASGARTARGEDDAHIYRP